MRRCVVLVAVSGCFTELAGGGSITPHAPAAPSGDGFYGRVGAGVGYGNLWGLVQASGDVEWIGGVAAVGGAARATVFLDSSEGEHGIAGIGFTARAFHGTGIGSSRATDERSLGVALAAFDMNDLWIDALDVSVSEYTTTFDDRSAMRSYGIHVGAALDPEISVKLAVCLILVNCPKDF